MTDKTSQILREAMLLSPDERAELADRLLDTLQSSAQRRIDEEWAAESEDRIDAYERGEISAIPADEVFKQLRNRPRP
jgi:putative addiction module component (TIGR02574 family)